MKPSHDLEPFPAFEPMNGKIPFIHGKDAAAPGAAGEPDHGGIGEIGIETGVTGEDCADFRTKSYLDFGTKVLEPTMGFWVNKP